MTEKTKKFSIITYITLIGWIIAFVNRDTNDEIMMQHINQSFVIMVGQIIISIITGAVGSGIIATILSVVSFALLILWIWGLVRAFKTEGEPLPLVGSIRLFQ